MKPNRLFRFVALVGALAAFAAPAPGHACSMCQCGDPTYRVVGDQMFERHAWRASLEAEHLGKDQVAESDPAARESEAENRATAAVAWCPVPRLRVVARVPLAWRTISAPDGRSRMAGLGDPDLLAHAQLLRRGADWLAVSAGLKTPWGQNDRTLGGIRAEEHLQPGTGATSLSAGLAASWTPEGASHVYVAAARRWNGRNAAGYRYGDVVTADLAWQRALSPRLSAAAELDYRFAARDDAAGARDPNTGGAVLYACPRLNLKLNGPFALRLGLQIPLVQNLFGDQREHTNLQSGLVIAR
jgi:hypothetical protein